MFFLTSNVLFCFIDILFHKWCNISDQNALAREKMKESFLIFLYLNIFFTITLRWIHLWMMDKLIARICTVHIMYIPIFRRYSSYFKWTTVFVRKNEYFHILIARIRYQNWMKEHGTRINCKNLVSELIVRIWYQN